eukprot:757896-Hanusia_phi.AAC.7
MFLFCTTPPPRSVVPLPLSQNIVPLPPISPTLYPGFGDQPRPAARGVSRVYIRASSLAQENYSDGILYYDMINDIRH